MQTIQSRSLLVLTALLAGLTAACGDEPLIRPTVLDAQATLSVGNAGEHIDGTFVLSLERDPEGSGAAQAILLSLDVIGIDGQGMADAFHSPHVDSDVSFPVSVEPGETVRVPFHFTADKASLHLLTGWDLWCAPADAMTGFATSLRFEGDLLDTVKDAAQKEGDTPFVGSGSIHRLLMPTVPPPASDVGALWSRRLGSLGDDAISGLAIDAGGDLLLTGAAIDANFGGGVIGAPGFFLAKLDPLGSTLWSRALPVESLVAAGGDAVMAAGSFDVTIDVGGGPLFCDGGPDIYLARLDEKGIPVWSRRFGDTNLQSVSTMAMDANGGVVLAGVDRGNTDFGGGPLPNQSGLEGVYIAKLDETGAHIFSNRLGGVMPPTAIATDASGATIAAGTTYAGTIDLGGASLMSAGNETWIMKLDAAGKTLWRSLPELSGEPTAVAIDATGNIYLTGSWSQIVKFSPEGEILWKHPLATATSVGSAAPTGIAVDDAGRIVVTGCLQNSVDLGNGSLGNGSTSLAFMVELAASGAALKSGIVGCCADPPTRIAFRSGAAQELAVAGAFKGFATFDQGPLESAGQSDIVIARLAP